jgi:hypothetical protein
MAELIEKTMKRLSPPGSPSNYQGGAAQVLSAIAVSLARPKEFLRAVQDEANPGTATATIDEWLALLNVSPEYGATLGDKRALAFSAWTALGASDIEYINGQIRKRYPNAFIYEKPLDEEESRLGEAEMGDVECSDVELTQLLYYVVSGYVDWARERYGLQSIISHIIPAHLTQIFQTRIQFDGDIGRCGIATAGRSIVGRSMSTYSPTNKTLGLVALGRCGASIVGRTA